MKKQKITLIPLTIEGREQFILDNQESFKFGAIEEFGLRDEHFNDDGEIISRETIERCIDDPSCDTYRIIFEERVVGGVIVKIDKVTNHNHLEILFTSPNEHSKGIGYGAWLEIERLYPETLIWETCTPYFEKRNIHFYINKCGFHVTEFWCEYNKDPNMKDQELGNDLEEGPDEMFKFIKVMKI